MTNYSINDIKRNYITPSSQDIHLHKEYPNRLYKNFKKLKKWADRENIECFRVYESDIPKYNIIVDIYKDWIIIQEYQAPKHIPFVKTQERLYHAIYHSMKILRVPPNKLVLKIRKPQKLGVQYQKLFNNNHFFIVKEYNFKFLVNLTDYLDTGLFSDKRLIRQLIYKISSGKHFLNLFAYTGTASVAAGLGGAKSTTTIDISKTYIQWSIKNMEINNLKNQNHFFIQEDCLSWLKKANKQFDLIFINPPTFSNSKKMHTPFVLKKHYFNLIILLKKILYNNGMIIFSSSTNNFDINVNDFKKSQLSIKKITKNMQSQDTLKKSKTYNTWIIKNI